MSASGLSIVLPVAAYDPGNVLPYKLIDPVMPDVNTLGALWLFDPLHPLGNFTGVPANGGAIPNVAAAQAATMTGQSAGSLQGVWEEQQSASNSITFARSAQGGLYILPSQTNNVSGDHGAIRASNAIKTYLLNNPTHSFYFSLWATTERNIITSGNAAPMSPAHVANSSSSTSNLLFHLQDFQISGSLQGGGQGFADRPNPTPVVGTPQFINCAQDAWEGTVPANIGAMSVCLAGAGSFDAWSGFNVNKAAAAIFYRSYIEDLTVSGRSYAQVDALDYAYFTKCFSAGGKFYGDTASPTPGSFG